MRWKICVCVYPISNKLQEGKSCIILIFTIPATRKVHVSTQDIIIELN